METNIKKKQIILLGFLIGFIFFTIMDTGEKTNL